MKTKPSISGTCMPKPGQMSAPARAGSTPSLLFSSALLGSLKLRNRLVMSPMQQNEGTADAHATDYHIEHYAARARGGVGLIIVESTAVAPEGRLYGDDIGIYQGSHVEPLAAIVRAVHAEGAAIALQLSHGGRKSHRHLGGRILAPSALAYDEVYGTPEAMTPEEIRATVEQFARAAQRALEAGFDALEIHAAHGYLIHQFLSPISNRRNDAYGGNQYNRGRLLREVFAAVRQAVGPTVPLVVRVSASDFDSIGLTPEDVAELLRPLIPLGLDAVDVSSGGLLPVVPPGIGPEYQVPFAIRIREALGIPVIAVGLIRHAARAEHLLQQASADFIAVGRPFLEQPDHARALRDELALASQAA